MEPGLLASAIPVKRGIDLPPRYCWGRDRQLSPAVARPDVRSLWLRHRERRSCFPTKAILAPVPPAKQWYESEVRGWNLEAGWRESLEKKAPHKPRGREEKNCQLHNPSPVYLSERYANKGVSGWGSANDVILKDLALGQSLNKSSRTEAEGGPTPPGGLCKCRF